MAKRKLWIKPAIKKPGALRRTVRARYGKAGFTARGTIKPQVLRKLSKEKHKRTGRTTKTARRARLALTLKGLRKKKKRK